MAGEQDRDCGGEGGEGGADLGPDDGWGLSCEGKADLGPCARGITARTLLNGLDIPYCVVESIEKREAARAGPTAIVVVLLFLLPSILSTGRHTLFLAHALPGRALPPLHSEPPPGSSPPLEKYFDVVRFVLQKALSPAPPLLLVALVSFSPLPEPWPVVKILISTQPHLFVVIIVVVPCAIAALPFQVHLRLQRFALVVSRSLRCCAWLPRSTLPLPSSHLDSVHPAAAPSLASDFTASFVHRRVSVPPLARPHLDPRSPCRRIRQPTPPGR